MYFISINITLASRAVTIRNDFDVLAEDFWPFTSILLPKRVDIVPPNSTRKNFHSFSQCLKFSFWQKRRFSVAFI